MIFTIDFTIPPSRLTFEQARQICDTCGRYGAEVSFDGYSGNGTISAESPAHYEAVNALEEAKAILTGITDGHRSFAEFFGKTTPLTYDNARAYTNMCLEGKIW